MKKVDDAATDTGVGAGWFKIDEVDYEGGKWASEIMAADGMTHEFKLPSNLAGGEYLVSSILFSSFIPPHSLLTRYTQLY